MKGKFARDLAPECSTLDDESMKLFHETFGADIVRRVVHMIQSSPLAVAAGKLCYPLGP